MSAALDFRRQTDGYFNLAQKYVTETEDLVLVGDTIAQSPEAFGVMLDMADRLIRAGGNGWVFVFADGSALATSNVSDVIWPRWVG
jgi:hypothetical protein